MPRSDPEAIRNGNRRALSRALTAVENNQPEGEKILSALFPHTGKAHLIGVTGAPGTGKSTLVNQLAKAIRRQGDQPPRVAIIAVDPTSPFSGGALLGDRIRMRDLAGDAGIFIRSMASRGALGGLAHATATFSSILDAAGYQIILIETVGAGQAEVDIARLAHTVLVLEAPGLGDEIQAIKAGILEIADILVVNKADRPGAENTASALKGMLAMTKGSGSLPTAGKHLRQSAPAEKPVNHQEQPAQWQTPVRLVTATVGEGIASLVSDIQAHRNYLLRSGFWETKERYRLQKDLEALIQDRLVEDWQASLAPGQLESALEALVERSRSPHNVVETLLKASSKGSSDSV